MSELHSIVVTTEINSTQMWTLPGQKMADKNSPDRGKAAQAGKRNPYRKHEFF